jgi:hypothetical protein
VKSIKHQHDASHHAEEEVSVNEVAVPMIVSALQSLSPLAVAASMKESSDIESVWRDVKDMAIEMKVMITSCSLCSK